MVTGVPDGVFEQGVDRQPVALGVGDEDERRVGRFVASERQGGKAVERRQTVIGQDQIGGIILQLLDKIVLVFDVFSLELEPGSAQLVIDQRCIGGRVLQQ